MLPEEWKKEKNGEKWKKKKEREVMEDLLAAYWGRAPLEIVPPETPPDTLPYTD